MNCIKDSKKRAQDSMLNTTHWRYINKFQSRGRSLKKNPQLEWRKLVGECIYIYSEKFRGAGGRLLYIYGSKKKKTTTTTT